MPSSRKSINLFDDKEIRCYKTVFNIINEEDLLQWWEYHLENSIDKYPESIKFIHALYRSCFSLLEKHNTHFDIIFEKSASHVYWTIWAKEEIDALDTECSHFKKSQCIRQDKRISFQLSTSNSEVKSEATPQGLEILKTSLKLHIYNFLDSDDKTQIIELNDELNEELVYLEGKGFSEKSIDKIQHLLTQYSLTLAPYREIHHIKHSIDEFSYFMNENRTLLIQLDKSYVSLFEGLILNLQKWFDALFVNGASSIEAYKKSITADVEIIKTMTLQREEEGEIEFF